MKSAKRPLDMTSSDANIWATSLIWNESSVGFTTLTMNAIDIHSQHSISRAGWLIFRPNSKKQLFIWPLRNDAENYQILRKLVIGAEISLSKDCIQQGLVFWQPICVKKRAPTLIDIAQSNAGKEDVLKRSSENKKRQFKESALTV